MLDRKRKIYNISSSLPRKKHIKIILYFILISFWVYLHVLFGFDRFHEVLTTPHGSHSETDRLFVVFVLYSTDVVLISFLIICFISIYGERISNFLKKLWNMFPD